MTITKEQRNLILTVLEAVCQSNIDSLASLSGWQWGQLDKVCNTIRTEIYEELDATTKIEVGEQKKF